MPGCAWLGRAGVRVDGVAILDQGARCVYIRTRTRTLAYIASGFGK